MLQEFILDLNNTYLGVLKGECILEHFLNKWNIDGYIGEFYEGLKNKENRKAQGSFYTPIDIVKYMAQKLSQKITDIKNVKILDPSCGGGYFLICMYDELSKRFNETDVINSLYGYDIDENAVMITTLELFRKSKIVSSNIIKRDFLFEDDGQYDFIIGNPPYVGHKMLDKDYRKKLKEKYSDVFSDKADLSYCFIKKSIDSLKNQGTLLFFISRYMLEALHGEGIRQYLLNNGSIELIIDFYGVRFVKGAGVDNIILNFNKSFKTNEIMYYRLKQDAKYKGIEVFEDIDNRNNKYYSVCKLDKEGLSEGGWIFLDDLGMNILNKIKGIELGSICESFQGIITGCDGAFIVTQDDIKKYNIEDVLLKKWIKNSYINKFNIDNTDSFIIYSDIIDSEEKYPNAIEFISRYRDRLEKRRECKKGVRKWYQLQWGRKKEYFEDVKIVYPYKADSNRFAVDKGSFYSADVYSLKIQGMFINITSYDFLVGVLNSRIYEFYIKSMAKKLGDDLYEYYPNKILNIKIPNYIKEIDDIVKEDISLIEKIDKVDFVLCKYFGITQEEYKYIKDFVKKY